jgi:hypothetical protein
MVGQIGLNSLVDSTLFMELIFLAVARGMHMVQVELLLKLQMEGRIGPRKLLG